MHLVLSTEKPNLLRKSICSNWGGGRESWGGKGGAIVAERFSSVVYPQQARRAGAGLLDDLRCRLLVSF
jgi:hypothetical protein